jgi:putative peptide zinc metalloprotease protein
VTAAPAAGAAVTATPYAAMTVVRDGAGYVLGRRGGTDFVAVPEIGGQVIEWLQDGASVSECEHRAADLAGEPVDVAGFLDGLARAGLLPAAPAARPGTAEPETAEPGGAAAGAEEPPAVAPWQVTAGQVMFGRAGLTVQAVLAVTAAVVLLAVPAARPAPGDGIATGVPLASLLLLAGLATVLGLAHEAAHVLAAWAAGVPSRISLGRRMIFVVYQTDLTRLWSVPRRARVVPLLAGLLFDSAATGILAVAGLILTGHAPLLVIHVIRLAVLLNVGAVAFQFLIFLRTDVYALFVLATGCRNLWATKGAAARQAIGRAGPADQAVLAAAGRRETRWARVFLGLYVPGVAATSWYLAAFAVPATASIVRACGHALATGPWSMAGAAAVLALALTAGSTAFVLAGLARSLARMARQVSRPAGANQDAAQLASRASRSAAGDSGSA